VQVLATLCAQLRDAAAKAGAKSVTAHAPLASLKSDAASAASASRLLAEQLVAIAPPDLARVAAAFDCNLTAFLTFVDQGEQDEDIDLSALEASLRAVVLSGGDDQEGLSDKLWGQLAQDASGTLSMRDVVAHVCLLLRNSVDKSKPQPPRAVPDASVTSSTGSHASAAENPEDTTIAAAAPASGSDAGALLSLCCDMPLKAAVRVLLDRLLCAGVRQARVARSDLLVLSQVSHPRSVCAAAIDPIAMTVQT
jgi:hypothetical protein